METQIRLFDRLDRADAAFKSFVKVLVSDKSLGVSDLKKALTAEETQVLSETSAGTKALEIMGLATWKLIAAIVAILFQRDVIRRALKGIADSFDGTDMIWPEMKVIYEHICNGVKVPIYLCCGDITVRAADVARLIGMPSRNIRRRVDKLKDIARYSLYAPSPGGEQRCEMLDASGLSRLVDYLDAKNEIARADLCEALRLSTTMSMLGLGYLHGCCDIKGFLTQI